MTELTDAIAVVQLEVARKHPNYYLAADPKTVNTILNAVASGALVPATEADELQKPLKAILSLAEEPDSDMARYRFEDWQKRMFAAVEALENAVAGLPDAHAALARALQKAREVTPEQAEMLAKEMQAIVAADRWKGRDLAAAPPEKWSHLRSETRQFWIDTATRILAALQPGDGQ